MITFPKKDPGHNTFVFGSIRNSNANSDIVFDSDFDSGNCLKVERTSLTTVKKKKKIKILH
jgi:hypothetical protein